jgi:membrane protein
MLGVVVAIPALLSVLGFSEGVEWLVQIGGYLVMAIVLLTGIAALYRFGPSPHGAKWRWITPGAILALIFIGIVSAIFSWYAANIGHFDQTYGSLGALLGFLFWMWVCLIAVIVGAELNSELDDLAKSQASAVTSDKAFGADPVNQVATSGRRRESTAELSAAKRSIPAKQVGLTLAGAVPLLLLIGILGIGRRRIGG